ncbi:MAG: hypothetical protein U0R52_10095 [Solirubrobacterales bacterium]
MPLPAKPTRRDLDDPAALLDQGKAALEQAETVEEVKEVRTRADTLGTLARNVGADLDAQNAIAEVRLRAERKAGALLATEVRPRGRHSSRSGALPEGISKSDSSRWQKEASVPEETFNAWVARTKDAGAELTSAGLRRLADRLARSRRGMEFDAPTTTPGITWPRYTGVTLDAAAGDDAAFTLGPEFSEEEWEAIRTCDEEAALEAAGLQPPDRNPPGSLDPAWAVTTGLQLACPLLRRIYEPDYGGFIVEEPGEGECRYCGVYPPTRTETWLHCHEFPLFVRRGWGCWWIAEFNDGEGGRDRRRFFFHDYAFGKLVERCLAAAAQGFKEAELIEGAEPATTAAIKEKAEAWLQGYTPTRYEVEFGWQGDSTTPRRADGREAEDGGG